MPTYNRRDALPKVLGPLLADDAAREVIVVVDGCSDGSYEYLRQLAVDHPRLKPILIQNSGQTAAQEAGLEQATSDVVLLLDDDVVPDPGLVYGHARHHARSTGLVVVGYMPVHIPTTRTPSMFSTVLYAQEYERAIQTYLRHPDEILHGLWMGNISLRRADCIRIGLFNQEWKSIAEFYHIDRDFGLRCMKGGLSAVFDRTLHGTHFMTRGLDGYLRYAREQGVGVVALHRLHGDILGPISLQSFTEDLPSAVRLLVYASRRPRLRRAIIGGTSGWIRIAGMFRMTPLQIPAARLARRIELVRGAREALYSDSTT